MKLKFYFPRGRIANTLKDALEFDESFVVATDDHSVVYFVDWTELDNDDRQEIINLLEKTEDEQAQELINGFNALDEVEQAMCRKDDEMTLIAWTTQ
jgi:hypothetical protein